MVGTERYKGEATFGIEWRILNRYVICKRCNLVRSLVRTVRQPAYFAIMGIEMESLLKNLEMMYGREV